MTFASFRSSLFAFGMTGLLILPTTSTALAAKSPKNEAYKALGFGPAMPSVENLDKEASAITGVKTDSDESQDSPRKAARAKRSRKAAAPGPKKNAAGHILVDPDRPLSATANAELTVPSDEKSMGELPTPATVRSSILAVSNPVTRPAFEFSVGISQYAPAGELRLPSVLPYDLSSLGSSPMVNVQFSWFPVRTQTAQPLSFGPMVELSYAQSNVDLRTPTGATVAGTQLHTMAGQLGGRMAWQPSFGSPWEAHLQVGVGELTAVQSSSSSFANHSASLSFASAGIFGERRLWEHLGVFVGYEHRVPVRGEPEEIVLQRSNFMAGLTGGFQ